MAKKNSVMKFVQNNRLLVAGVVIVAAIYWNQQQIPTAPNMYNNPAGMRPAGMRLAGLKAPGWY